MKLAFHLLDLIDYDVVKTMEDCTGISLITENCRKNYQLVTQKLNIEKKKHLKLQQEQYNKGKSI